MDFQVDSVLVIGEEVLGWFWGRGRGFAAGHVIRAAGHVMCTRHLIGRSCSRGGIRAAGDQ